jgi:hypothetical protein
MMNRMKNIPAMYANIPVIQLFYAHISVLHYIPIKHIRNVIKSPLPALCRTAICIHVGLSMAATPGRRLFPTGRGTPQTLNPVRGRPHH